MFLKRIKELRDRYDIIQKDLAKVLGVSKSTYSRWETDENIIPLNHFNDLCNYFKVSMDYMTGLTDEKQYKNTNTKLNKKIIGSRIKEFRKGNNLTQEELAEIIHTSHSTISSYENGKTMILTAFAFEISKKYDISLDYLVGRVNKNNIKK